MATARIILPIPGGVAPDGSGSTNAPAQPSKVVSSGTQTSGTPKLSYVELLFDQTTAEHWMWPFALPEDYASGGTLRFYWGAKVTSGEVVWKAGAEVGALSSTDMDAAVFNAKDQQAAAGETVPGTVGHVKESTIALTMTGSGAGLPIVVFIGRDTDDADDDAAGDASLFAVVFEYTT